MLVLSRRAIVLPPRVRPSSALLALAILVVAWVGYQFVRGVPLLGDESRHYERIHALRGGSEPAIHASSLHSYHAVLAAACVLADVESIEGTRLLSLFVALLCLPVAYGIVRKMDRRGATLAAAQLFFLPVLLPFLFLLYTDSLGLLCVLLAVLLAWDGCLWGAALASAAGALVRQTHVVWMLFAFVLPYVRAHGWRLERAALMDHLRRGWLFVPGFAGFALFVIVNKGVALGDRQYHPAFEFRPGNVLFALFIVFVVFLPLHIANLPRIVRLVRERPWLVLAAGGVFLLLSCWTSFDHPFNGWGHFLRNKVLRCVKHSSGYRALFFLLAGVAVLSLAVTELKERSLALLYPMAVLSLAPSWLIDPRYAIPALALFVLFRARRSWKVEWAGLGWGVLLSLLVLNGIFREAFFL